MSQSFTSSFPDAASARIQTPACRELNFGKLVVDYLCCTIGPGFALRDTVNYQQRGNCLHKNIDELWLDTLHVKMI